MLLKPLKSNKGSFLAVGFIALTVIIILGISYLSMSASSLITAKRDVQRAQAFEAAEAGIEQAIDFLYSGGPGGEEFGEWRTNHPSVSPNDHTNDSFYIETFPTETNIRFKICAKDGAGVTANKVVVTSIGESTIGDKTITKTIKAVINLNKENISVWNNAIFAGAGQASKSINGNISIKGSVHVLGDGEPFTDLDNDGNWSTNETYTDSNHNGKYDLGEPYTDSDGDGHRDAIEPYLDINGNGTRDPALTVTDMATEVSGNANIGNNYDGMNATISTHVPILDKKLYGGQLVETLDAKLRVKNGKVNVSGSASVGDPEDSSNLLKDTLNGVYVSDGFGGNAGASSVHADNGTANGYDLGEGAVKLPYVTFGEYVHNGTTYTNYMAYLKANATVITGDLNINKGTAVSYSGPNGSISVNTSGNITISGLVYVTGNINVGPAKANLTYDGVGTLVTENSSYFHASLMPVGKFATDDTLGIIAAKNIELATGSGDAQLNMAMAMYAQQQIVSSKQNSIAGTMVASYFSMSNVPSIYQVPALADNLPPGMPAGEPIWVQSMNIESWEGN